MTRTSSRPRRDDAITQKGMLMITVDVARHEVMYGKKEVALSPVEFKTLILLGSKPGIVFSRDEITKHVWMGRREPSDNRTIDQHISRLRRKMRGINLRTVNCYGYALKEIKVIG